MQIVFHGLVHEPDIALIPRTAPEMLMAVFPAIQDRLVLALIISTAQREGVFRPDDEGRPFAARLRKRAVERMKLR